VAISVSPFFHGVAISESPLFSGGSETAFPCGRFGDHHSLVASVFRGSTEGDGDTSSCGRKIITIVRAEYEVK
jgi:hypothetical protein